MPNSNTLHHEDSSTIITVLNTKTCTIIKKVPSKYDNIKIQEIKFPTLGFMLIIIKWNSFNHTQKVLWPWNLWFISIKPTTDTGTTTTSLESEKVFAMNMIVPHT